MDYISKIAEMYHENILLQPQYTGGNNLHPLCQRWDLRNDGNPKTGEIMPIGWIVYPYEMMVQSYILAKGEKYDIRKSVQVCCSD